MDSNKVESDFTLFRFKDTKSVFSALLKVLEKARSDAVKAEDYESCKYINSVDKYIEYLFRPMEANKYSSYLSQQNMHKYIMSVQVEEENKEENKEEKENNEQESVSIKEYEVLEQRYNRTVKEREMIAQKMAYYNFEIKHLMKLLNN